MSTSIRQSNLFAAEDWRKLYNTFRSADFQSYDYETLRKSMVDYIRTYYPEDYNDYIESSEFIALLDLISFMGQSISYRGDLNFRENFLQTAERRDSVYRMANMLGYNPNRNQAASGMLKIVSLNTTEDIIDSNGNNLSNRTVNWNDPTDNNWLEKYTAIINSVLSNNQRVGKPASSFRIGNTRHDLYEFKTTPNQVPLLNFSSTVDNISMAFNIYNVGLSSTAGVYEKSPRPGDTFGFLYKNDTEGNRSPNTGFFVGFKQGNINNLDFTIGERIPNRLVSLNADNINNTDTWLFEINDAGAYLDQWTEVDQLRDSNVIYNNVAQDNRKIFSVYSRANDQVDYVFGDGVFSEIPVGIFRAVTRTGNGLSYTITPNEMQNVNVDLPYITKSGKTERLRLTLSLQSTISNASTRESLSQIKLKAPQNFYSQNRMVNGEDYNTVPYIKYGDILKIKSVNRTSSGISRFLELKDVTGKYSSTNIFCEDGYIYKEEDSLNSKFNWTTAADVQSFISNQLGDILKAKESINLYYYSYSTKIPPTTYWIKGTAETTTSTGFFVLDYQSTSYEVQQIGNFTANNRKFIKPGSLLLFRAPAGYYFDIDRMLTEGTPSQEGQVTELWASVKSVEADGTAQSNGWLNNQTQGPGPIVLTENIPTGAELVEIYPVYNTNLTSALSQTISKKIINNEDFALRYNQELQDWAIINPSDIKSDSAFDLANTGNTSRSNLDASWHVLLTNEGLGRYNVLQRRLNFLWGSELETRFYFDPLTQVYDSRNASVIKDQIRILKGNTLPDSSSFLSKELQYEIYNTIDFADGYSDDTKVKITYADSDNDSVPDDPRVFDTIVDAAVNPLNKLVFFEKYLDYDSIERYRYFDSSAVVTRFPTLEAIENDGRYAYTIGTVFYATNEKEFYELKLIEDVRTISSTENYIVRVGRDKLKFQYRHNSPNDKRIDPSASNIIDMYILTEAYNNQYRIWLGDTTGLIEEPEKPTLVDMSVSYQDLNNVKSVSDSISFNSAEFKILFGNKASRELQATFKVVRAENSRISNSEIRTRVIDIINKYFDIEYWDFGDTFYFSELGAYIHRELAQDIGSVVIVPKTSSQNFGELFQISCKPNEIFVSSATVDDVEIIDSVTATQLQNKQSVNIFGGYTPLGLRNSS
jgi:hypothetical protein